MSKLFVSLRMQNLKMNQLDKANNHNMRLVEVPNAKEGGYHKRTFGDNQKTIEQLLMTRLNNVGADFKKMGVKKKPQSDAASNIDPRSRMTTVVNEYVLSASPAFFHISEHDQRVDKQKLSEWIKVAEDWAKKEFGDNLLCMDLHCDESTPHFHICVAPLIEKTKNLRRTKEEIAAGVQKTASVWSFSNLEINTKDTMRERQTSVAEAFKELGLSRGIPSKAKHQTIKDFYKTIQGLETETDPRFEENGIDISKLEKFDLIEPSIFKINESKNWINKTYKQMKKLINIITKQNEINERNQNRNNKLYQAAIYYKGLYENFKEIFKEFKNDPDEILKKLSELTKRADDSYESGFNAGLDAERSNSANTIRKLKSEHLEEIKNKNERISLLTQENNDLLAKHEEVSDKLNRLYNLKKSKDPTLSDEYKPK